MKKNNHLSMDAALLRTMVVLHEEQSVSRAAERLALTQSALSHRLSRLKSLFGPNLFVRSGRKIASTPETALLVAEARTLLIRMERMVNPEPLAVAMLDDTFVLAATDYERHLFLIDACRSMLAQAPLIKLNLMWEKYDNRQKLRDGQFDLVCGPIMEHTDLDLHHEIFFYDEFSCFYDPDHAIEPSTLEGYSQSRHARVIFSKDDSSFVDTALAKYGLRRDVAIDIPSLSEVSPAIRGTPFIVTAPSLTAKTMFRDLACCPVPFSIPSLPFGIEWHDRTDSSPRHDWIRSTIRDHAKTYGELSALGHSVQPAV